MKDGEAHPSKTHFDFCVLGKFCMLIQHTEKKKKNIKTFLSEKGFALNQGQKCQPGLQPLWTPNWKLYLGRYPAKGSVKYRSL